MVTAESMVTAEYHKYIKKNLINWVPRLYPRVVSKGYTPCILNVFGIIQFLSLGCLLGLKI